MTRFRDKGSRLRAYSTADKPPCSGFAPDSLVQQNKNACPSFLSGSRICHKISRVYGYPPNGGGSLFSQCRPLSRRAALSGQKLSSGQSDSFLLQIRAGVRRSYNHFIPLTVFSSQPAVSAAFEPELSSLLFVDGTLLFAVPLLPAHERTIFADW